MKSKIKRSGSALNSRLMTELLILPDGRIFVQNLTQPMAELLHALNPADQSIAARNEKLKKTHEFPNRA